MHTWTTLALPAAFCTALFAADAVPMPRTGARLPAFEIADVTGQMHRSAEIHGRPALVIALTSSEAGQLASTWFERARERFGTSRVHYITVVSMDMPHLIPTSFARNAARQHTPREVWHVTWFDRSGAIRRKLGLSHGDHVPYVMAVDRDGNVAATVHSAFDPNVAQAIWSALERAHRSE